MNAWFNEKVLNNFSVFDKVLTCIPSNRDLYKILFFVRTSYCVDYELADSDQKIKWIKLLKRTLRFVSYILIYPFYVFQLDSESKIMILNTCRWSVSSSEYIGFPLLVYRKRFCLFHLSVFKDLFSLVCQLFNILKISELSLKKKIYLLPKMIQSYKLYKEINFSFTKMIITYDDVLPIATSILMKAKEQGILSIRVENGNIGRTMYNNVFCDYYFYPTYAHRIIREESYWNDKLIYIKGGFVDVSYNAYSDLKCNVNNKYICFFTTHSNIFAYSDHFYIKKILEIMPKDYVLLIKIHPNENISDYNYLENNSLVNLYTYGQISNSELISISSITLSQFSALSYESKYFCENTYFINYNWRQSFCVEEYSFANNYIEIIDSDEFLQKVILRKHITKSIEIFRENYNMTYPHTFKVLKDFALKCVE